MAIVGVGIDALEVERLRRALERTPGILSRLFTEQERLLCASAGGGLKIGGLAARFAAKEAVAKAIGTGLVGFGFRDLEILRDPRGRPQVFLHGGAAAAARRQGIGQVHVSLSTSGPLALATAVAESPE